MAEFNFLHDLAAARGGDAAAIERLLSNCKPIAEEFAEKILRFQNITYTNEDLEDIVSISLKKAALGISKQHGSFPAWFHRIVKNTCLDHGRSRSTLANTLTQSIDGHTAGSDPDSSGAVIPKSLVTKPVIELKLAIETAVRELRKSCDEESLRAVLACLRKAKLECTVERMAEELLLAHNTADDFLQKGCAILIQRILMVIKRRRIGGSFQ